MTTQFCRTPRGDVVITFTPGELRALAVLVHEGREGILTDASAARSYIGGRAAQNAAVTAADKVAAARGSLLRGE